MHTLLVIAIISSAQAHQVARSTSQSYAGGDMRENSPSENDEERRTDKRKYVVLIIITCIYTVHGIPPLDTSHSFLASPLNTFL